MTVVPANGAARPATMTDNANRFAIVLMRFLLDFLVDSVRYGSLRLRFGG
jgi:hypothetical protein